MATINVYNKFKLYIGDGTIDLDNDQLKIALLDSNHSFVSTHTDWSQVSANEISAGNGYTGGGKVLVNVTWTETGGTATLDADNVTWTATGGALGPASHAIIYDDTATDDKLICSIDFEGSQTAGEGTEFRITFNSNGILRLS
jgi:hypothetical protein